MQLQIWTFDVYTRLVHMDVAAETSPLILDILNFTFFSLNYFYMKKQHAKNIPELEATRGVL